MSDTPISSAQLQILIQQFAIDLTNFTSIVNGDSNAIITLPSGTVVPSIQKVIRDIQQSFATLQQNFTTIISGGSEALLAVLQNTKDIDFAVVNPNIDQIFTIPNLLVVYNVSVNGLDQNDSSYTRAGNVIKLPVSNGFNVGDEIQITYIPLS